MTQLNPLSNRFATQLFAFDKPATPGQLAFFRIFELFICGFTLQLTWTWAAYMQTIEAVVLPLGLANYIDVSVLYDGGRSYMVVAALTVFLALGYLRYWRFAYGLAILLFHVLYAARYSLGEISHGSNFVGNGVLALALGTWLFRQAPEKQFRYVFGFLYFFYGLGYTSAGVCKLVATGINWPASEHFALWIGERSADVTSAVGTFELNFVQRLALDYPAIGTLTLAFGLLAELAGFLMWFRATRPYILAALIGMHIGVDVTLNIYFGHNIYLLVLLLVPWGRAIDGLSQYAPPRLRQYVTGRVGDGAS